MIKGWMRFNESVDGRFTEEMAMEIVYYFSEDSKPSKSIEKLFFDNPETNNLFSFYESGYDEYKAATKKLYGVVNSGSSELKEKIFQVYNMIREERMKGLKAVVDTVSVPTSVPVEEDTTIIPTPEVNVMDSILLFNIISSDLQPTLFLSLF
jgi:hypothetical protein